MKTIHIDRKDLDKVRPIINASFPGYSGQKVKVVAGELTINTTSHWDGGSRNQFVVLNLSTLESKKLGQSGTMFDRNPPLNIPVSKDLVIVEHSIFRGKDHGLTIYIHPDNINKLMIEDKQEDLTLVEKAVIIATDHLKPSYGGVKDLRKAEILREFRGKIMEEEIDQARLSLIDKEILKKNKSLTTRGKNIAESLPNSLFSLAK